MDSLSPECTPLKHKYDSCFNAWFEGYLQPVVLTSGSSSSNSSSPSSSSSTASAGKTTAATPAALTEETIAAAATTANSYSNSVSKQESSTLDQGTSSVSPRHETSEPGPSSRTLSSSDHRQTAAETEVSPWLAISSLLNPTGVPWTLREDEKSSHPDLYPFLSRRRSSSSGSSESQSTPHGPTSSDHSASQAPLSNDLLDMDENAEGEEEIEELAQDEKTAIEAEFGPEDPITFEDLGGAAGLYDVEVQQVEMAAGLTEEEMRRERSKLMAEEYERNCGSLWTDYQACLQKAIEANQPLSALLDQARQENPLESAVPLGSGGFGAAGSEP